MQWQDLIIGVGSFVFALALIPMIRSKSKTPISTSLPTALFLWAFVATYISFDLWLSVVSGSLSALGWTILLIKGVKK